MQKTIRVHHLYKTITLGIGLVVLVILCSLIVKQTAMGKEQRKIQEILAYATSNEEEYKENIQESLELVGCKNSGITLTKTVDTDGHFCYYIQIHHKNLSLLNELEKEALFETLDLHSGDMESILQSEECITDVTFFYQII